MRTVLLIVLCSSAALAQKPEFVRIPLGSLNGMTFDREYWIGRTEVTVSQFAAFVRATGYVTAAERSHAARTWKTAGFDVRPDQPVVYVSINDGAAYCSWIGGRLPSDAEWEYAARAGFNTRHYWGDKLDDRYLWYRGNSEDRPRAAGKKRPNRWGLHDMEGNVWEWTMSEPSNGEAMGNRRGGSWVDCEDIQAEPGKNASPLIGISTCFKIPVKLEHRYDDIGFRCVR